MNFAKSRPFFGKYLLLMAAICVASPAIAFTADDHAQNGVKCVKCHGEDKPKTPANGEACLKCHESFASVAKRTEGLVPNPHRNHLVTSTEPDCTECHQGHQADKILCAQCHAELTFEKKK